MSNVIFRVFKGSVTHLDQLPDNPEIGDCYMHNLIFYFWSGKEWKTCAYIMPYLEN